MNLKHETKTVYKVDYDDLEDFIKEVYGQEYSFVADIEGNNYESHDYIVKKEVIPDYQQKELKKFIDTGSGLYLIYTILKDLVNKDLIDEGNYIINISW